MALRDFANVVLSTSGPALSQIGFGTVACAAYHTKNQDWSRTYSNLSDLVADGFLTYEPAYKMAQAAFSQEPRTNSVKILRLPTAWSFIAKLTPYTPITQIIQVFSCTLVYRGVEYLLSFTSDATPTATEVVAGLASAFGALPAAISADFSASGASTTDCIFTAGAAGRIMYFKDWSPNLKFENTSADPGIAADLANIRNNDSDWYGLSVDNESKAIILAADGWAESQDIMGASQYHDTAVLENTAGNVALTLKAQSAGRWFGVVAKRDTSAYGGTGALGERFPFDPGSEGAGGTWHGKTIKGLIAGGWSTTQKGNVRGANVMYYEVTAGASTLLDGKVAGGEFADVVRFLDWYRIRSEEAVAQAIISAQKIPFTDRGIGVIYTTLKAIQTQGELVEGFVPGTSTLNVPKRTDVPLADRRARKLTGITGTVTLAGAIHLVDPINIAVGN
jgi:hypothetical protein